MKNTRPAWIEVNLDNIKHNIEVIRREVAEHSKILSIVKADGYAFGANHIVKALKSINVENFAVATGNEAIGIRKEFSDINILVLGYTPSYLMEEMIANNIQMSTYSIETAKELNSLAEKLNKKAKIHIVIDSGMNRIGFKPTEESVEIIEEISKLGYVEIIGMFTHFAVADTNDEYTKKQYSNFRFVADKLAEKNIHPLLHVSNSHAILRYREFDLDFVRPGILQYGSTEEDPYGKNFNVKFIASIKAEIGHVKTIPAGEGISYGLTYITDKETEVATLPLGYADGIPRLLSNKIDVLVNGKRCPQIGRICMDQFMIDVTGVGAKVGDEVVIIGKQGNEEITIEEISKLAGEIPTSFVTHFNKRFPRVYIENGNVIDVLDQIK